MSSLPFKPRFFIMAGGFYIASILIKARSCFWQITVGGRWARAQA